MFEENDEDSAYIRQKKIMNTVFYEIKNLEQQLLDMKVSLRSHAAGVSNVYGKFMELETRQKEIESLLKSDRVKEMIEAIPTEETIHKMLRAINEHPIADIQDGISKIREDFEALVDRFTF